MFKLPFSVLPGSWGLKGKSRELAKAEYELFGKALEIKIAKIDCGSNVNEYKRRILNIDFKYNIITEYELKTKLIEIEYDVGTPEYALEIVKIDHDFNKIDITESNKRTATIKKEPWVAVINSQYNKKLGKDGFSFELDWNEIFILMLKQHGYDNTDSDMQIVEQWFDDVANSQLNESDDDTDEENTHTLQKNKINSEIIKDNNGSEKKRFY